LLDCSERIDDIEGGDGGYETCGDIKFLLVKHVMEIVISTMKVITMVIVRLVGECGF